MIETNGKTVMETLPLESPPDHPPFSVVGIGASAGGLEAFTQLLAKLPSKTGMAFVLVQHLDPSHDSQLTELLSKVTSLPVEEVTDGTAISPDHVYVIPPNTNMALVKNKLRLTPRGGVHTQHLPLDLFFRSLAEDRHSHAIGVVLSGTGSDGSSGLAEIKAAGGITFAQSEDSAQYPEMPHNAISSSAVDFVLSPEEIAGQLGRLSQHPYLHPSSNADEGTEPSRNFEAVLGLLRATTGVDFGAYRDTTIKRRIARRMVLQTHANLSSYLRFLEKNAKEVEALYRDILINVTSFFRDGEVFEVLKQLVFPELINGKSQETPIRIWVPGCSTGQEVYSLAIALLEFLDDQPIRPTLQLFGTDINDQISVEKARLGLYPHSIESEVSPERLRRFFTKEERGYRIGKSIREMCVFAKQNVAVDPPFSKMDLISCRNLLIYLSAPLQKRIIPTFHYSLNPKGFLLLGASETVGRLSELFAPVDKKHNIYSRIPTLTRVYPRFLEGNPPPRPASSEPAVIERPPNVADMQKEADRILLGQYAPAAVLISENLEILQFRGHTRPYLEPASGQASLNLLKMARDNLFVDLRSAVEEAKNQNATVRRQRIRLRDNEVIRLVNLEVKPVRLSGFPQRCFLVVFTEAAAPFALQTEGGGTTTSLDARDQEIAQLRQELVAAKEYLQAVIEQQNVVVEELQAANEESSSSNEELQSTNEEMQTAKEELQSTNEELRTVNDELGSRNREVNQANDDLTNTMASMNLALVMISRDLHIRSFTRAAGAILNLAAGDVGGLLRDAKARIPWQVSDLETLVLEVMGQGVVADREIQTNNGHWYALRLHPYRTADNRIDGVVLALLDIHQRRVIEGKLVQLSQAKDHFLATLSHELRTPLTPVAAAVSLLQGDPRLHEEIRPTLEMIRRNVELETMLIDDLLDLTRITRGKLEMQRENVDLGTVLSRAVEVCAPDIKARGVEFGLDLRGLPIYVNADTSRLQQVFWNLLKNAIKFTPVGGCIGLHCHRLDEGHVVIEVRDSGVGIEPEALARIFDAFEQADRNVTRQFGGLGLGLAISRSLVAMHDGTISAHSEGKGKGATFRVVLPTIPGLATAVPGLAGGSGQGKPAIRPARILLVEDHGDTAEIMRQILESKGHHVRTAGDVGAALAAAGKEPFDLVISDLGLPDGSGLDLMRQLKERHGLRGIALSGFGMEEDIAKSRDAGFEMHMTKPVNLPKLDEMIQAIGAAKP